MRSLLDATPKVSGNSPQDFGMLEPEFHDTYSAWKLKADPSTRGALLRAVNPVLDTATKSYGGGSATPTLRSQAKLRTIQAFDTYDPKKATLRTHLLSQLRSLQRDAGKLDQIIRIPEQISILSAQLQRAETDLSDDLGRPPSDTELADHLGITLRRLQHIRKAHVGVNSGIFRDEVGDQFDPAARSLAKMRTDPVIEMAYYDLQPSDQLILELSLGLHGKRPQSTEAIAKKLRVSSASISQRKKKIQERIDTIRNANLGV